MPWIANQFQLILLRLEQRIPLRQVRDLVPFALQFVRANSVCPSWSLRMIRSVLTAMSMNVSHRSFQGSTHQLWALPCVLQACSPQARTLGCLRQQMPASSLMIGMMLPHSHSTTFHRLVRSRLRSQPTRFPQQVQVSRVWFQRHEWNNQLVQNRHMFVIACSPP